MSRFTYTDEMVRFLSEQYKQHGIGEVTAAFNKTFDAKKTCKQIKSAITNHGIKCGRTTGQIRKGKLLAYTHEQANFIREKYPLLELSELTTEFNKAFGSSKTEQQIRAFTRNHGIKSGRTGQFEKGQKSWNDGKKGWTAGGRSAETRFKPGHKMNDVKPVGSTRICSKDGYVIVKVAMPSEWRLMHIVEWEKHHGPIPKGHRIWFKDNDRTNWHIDNLMLITRAQGAVLNKLGLGKVDAEHKTAAVIIADISMKRRELLKGSQA